MNELDFTYESIDSNEFLSADLKENFKELITVFHQLFSKVDLSNFNERIKRLRIKKGSKFFITSDCEYNPRENILYINEDKIKMVDAKHSLMMSVLSIITAKDNFYGFNDTGTLEGLNKGITELIANFLVGNEVDLDEE
ncbi:MAG: hypothetical protein II309_08010 [Bacilli bacterium]|nr:hypothetical protein [Bacilli bacterium]